MWHMCMSASHLSWVIHVSVLLTGGWSSTCWPGRWSLSSPMATSSCLWWDTHQVRVHCLHCVVTSHLQWRLCQYLQFLRGIWLLWVFKHFGWCRNLSHATVATVKNTIWVCQVLNPPFSMHSSCVPSLVTFKFRCQRNLSWSSKYQLCSRPKS